MDHLEQYSKIKTITKKTLYPHNNFSSCVAMLLDNLAEPNWIQMPYEQAITTHVFCLLEKGNEHLIEKHAKILLPPKSCIFIKKPLSHVSLA